MGFSRSAVARLRHPVIAVIILTLIAPVTGSRAAVSDVNEFRFISWGDSQIDQENSTLSAIAAQASLHQPAFTIFNGDLTSWGFSLKRMVLWRNALDAAGLFDQTFPVRGNHDPEFPDEWQAFFDLNAVATNVDASHLSALEEDLSYSFDYRWGHFVGIDLIYGIADALTIEQIAWLDGDLTAAEARGQSLSFLYMHDSPYCVGWANCTCEERICSPTPTSIRELVNVINRHPSVVATFHGHNHVQAYVHIDSSRIPEVTHPYEQFHTSPAGLDLSIAKDRRVDWYQTAPGYAVVIVRPEGFQVEYYILDESEPSKTLSFLNLIPPTSTSISTQTETPTETQPPASTPSPVQTATPAPSAAPTEPLTIFYEWQIYIPLLAP